MKYLTAARRVLTRACVFYTVLITAAYFLGASVNTAWLPTVPTVVSLLCFALWLGLSAEFLASDLLTAPIRMILHFAATFLLFYLTFLRLGGYLKNGGSLFTAAAVYVFVYAVCAVVVLLVRWLTADAETKGKPYRSLFDARDGGKKDGEYEPQFGDKREERRK